jgi:3-methyladenine DNA glycosylase AlkD
MIDLECGGQAAALAAELAKTSGTQPLRKVRQTWSRKLRRSPAEEVLDLARQVLPICRFVAYELIATHRPAAAMMNEQRLVEFAGALASWNDVDCFGMYLAGPSWRAALISDAVVTRWAGSKDRWWRRAALVATIISSRAGDARPALRIGALLTADRDDMVVKALSWALRELSKKDAAAVRAFLAEHEVAARVRREVTRKLETGGRIENSN